MAERKAGAETFILFELAGTSYGVRSRTIQQMEMLGPITLVPNAPPYVEGVAFFRGQVIPAVSLRARFGFPRIPHDIRTRLLVVNLGGRAVGLIADSAREFVGIPPEAIQPPPEAVAGPAGAYLEGIATLGERLVLILNVEGLLAPSDIPSAMPAEA